MPEEIAPKPQVYMAERFQPEAVMSQPRKDSFTWAAILAIISLVLFIVIIAMQYLENTALAIA